MKISAIPLSQRLEACGAAPDLSAFHVQAKALARTLDEIAGGGEYYQDRMREQVYSLYHEDDEDAIRLYIILTLTDEMDDGQAVRLLRFLLLDPFTKAYEGGNP